MGKTVGNLNLTSEQIKALKKRRKEQKEAPKENRTSMNKKNNDENI